MKTLQERVSNASNAVKTGVHVSNSTLRELIVEIDQATNHWAKKAAEGHRAQIKKLSRGKEKQHLIYMLDTIRDQPMSIGKVNRWLSWIQATLVHKFGVATLEEMKQHNKAYSE